MDSYKNKLNLLCILLLLPLPIQLLVGFLREYAIRQTIYPLAVLGLVGAGFFLLFKKTPVRAAFCEKVRIRDVICCIFIFLTVTTLSSQVMFWLCGPQSRPAPASGTEYLISLFVLCILPAVCEEFIYRGMVIGILGAHNEKAATLLSALLFALMHGTVQQIPVAFFAGLVLGYFYVRHRSLPLCILLHFCNNFFSVTYSVIYQYVPNAVILIMLTAAGMACLLLYPKKYLYKSEVPLPYAVKEVMGCGMLWVYILAFALNP